MLSQLRWSRSNATVTSQEPGSKVQLEIEVPADEVARHFARPTATWRRARHPRIPPGKAPRPVIDRFAGPEPSSPRRSTTCVDAGYDAALDQTRRHSHRPAPGRIDTDRRRSEEPARFTADVAVRPERRPGRLHRLPVQPGDRAGHRRGVEAVINELRAEQATLRPIDDRAAAEGRSGGGLVRSGTIDGEPFDGASPSGCRLSSVRTG